MLLLLAGLTYSLRYQPVQTYFAKKAASYLSRELHTTVSVDGLYFQPFSSLVLNGLFIADAAGDTLLYAHQLTAAVDLWKLRNGRVIVKHAKLSDGSFYLKRFEKGTNLSFIIDYFSPTAPLQPSQQRISLAVHSLDLSNITFAYKQAANHSPAAGINFKDIQLAQVSGNFTDIDFTSHLFKSTIKNLSFREKSGFLLREMDAIAVVDTTSIELQKLYIATNRSLLRNRLRLEYPDFSAFSNFMKDVAIELNLDHAQIDSRDVEFFAPKVAATHFDAVLSGTFSGTIAAFVAKRVAMQLGSATHVQGDFSVTGLPDINQTVFDMQIQRLTTNSEAIESLVPQLGNLPALDLPASFDRLENVTYQGTLKGFYYDFMANGTFETALGLANVDMNLNIREGGRYSGRLSADAFNLEPLFPQTQLGQASFDLTVTGTGFTFRDMHSNVAGRIGHLDFRGYRYTNIDLQSELAKLRVMGDIGIRDPNLRLTAKGGIDFSPEWPQYAFHANVRHAHLPNIRLYGKERVIINGADVAADFGGKTLNDLQGNIAIRGISFQVGADTHTVDSLILAATGYEGQRTLRLRSTLADASLAGTVDLTTLGNYFKSVAMRFAPSLGWDVGKVGRQAFDFDLTLKNFAPLAALFMPRLTLPEDVSMNAHFSTADTLSYFNLLVPQLSYGNVKVKRLIVDESTRDGALRLSVTADRMSLTDSLYVNNINLSNVILNDSLHFNLKLADVTANNQLDLNGLVNFEKNALLQMQLLPSSLILNKESWQLDENARLYFNEGRLTVQGLEISNNHQVVQLEGNISPDADDNAALTFKNFNLNTLNSITLPSGIELSGVLNGRMDVSSILKNPYALADIEASSVHFNHTQIGNVRLQADFDQTSELVNVRLEVVNGDVNTLTATGTYNAAAETDKLNVKATLNQSELLVFQPFLGKLVSDINGTVSANLRITGSVLAPQVSGTCFLHNAGFTVNYLKTPYRINDEVALENSTIILNNLKINDPENNQAIANGKVDMSNLLVPDIDVVIDATDFLLLNTTFRDNSSYYGTAYGTGRFAFRGPTNAITIDIQARTNESTSFHIPLNAVGTVSDNDFIRFVSHDTLDAQHAQSRLLKGLSMNMDLQITPEAEASLYTDLGELSGRGEGLLSLRISSLGDFEMFGDYLINAGKFTFIAQDFINKIFDINQGGTIRWTGQPTDATIGLTAVYGQRTSLAPLYNAAGRETVEQRVLAQAIMNLNGNLMRPDITFALHFPNDPYVKDELQSYLSDVNNINQQALSLIVRRSFAPGAATDFSRELNNTLLSAGTELAFNQLNNLIAQSLNLNFIDLNIRSLNDASASFRFFNDRLVFTGGVTDRRNLNDLNVFSDRVVTDAELLYLIRKDGRLVLRGSNRLNSRNFLPLTMNENYVSALGLVYRQEFYTFQEYFRRLFTLRRKTVDEEEETGEARSDAPDKMF
ncbi:translocation/assembly module TamB domain-containing protein [Parapedobacter koreensis]|uniref:translocation/assembly module TamB domain-containing protein n=1 Tax=Parapedobacter koreensis TaxID=332977 RepID=UPI0015A6536A|nr:translocation/assembly module TamB domain-containing protein [Parapedobacter koreensis]